MNSKHTSPVLSISRHSAMASGALAFLALALVVQGCSSESASPPAGTGGSSATGTGGSSAGSGGNSTPAATGGSSASGSGGASTSAGTGGSAATGTGGSGSTANLPLCVAQAKGGACTMEGEACNKACGPKSAANASIGVKSETCAAAFYAEGVCTFPAGDYACFKVTATTAACPAATSSGGACTVDSCIPCSGYTDSTAAPKVGYCHCVNMKWTCGSTKEWPCTATGTSTSPGGTGC